MQTFDNQEVDIGRLRHRSRSQLSEVEQHKGDSSVVIFNNDDENELGKELLLNKKPNLSDCLFSEQKNVQIVKEHKSGRLAPKTKPFDLGAVRSK